MHTKHQAERSERTQRSSHHVSAAAGAMRHTVVKQMVKKFAGVSVALMALALSVPFVSGTVQAQRLCGDRAQILKALEQNHKETVHAIGIAEDGGFLEVLVSPTGGWTILVTYPKRQTCVVVAGQDWNNRFLNAGQPT